MATGRHAATQRSAWKPLAVAALGAGVLMTTGFGVFASLSATATNTTPQTASSGTLALTLSNNGVGFGQAVTAMAPGDTVHRYVTLTQSGTLAAKDLTLSVTTGTPNALTGTGSSALRFGIATCSGDWTPTTGACNGTTTQVIATTTTLASAITAPVTVAPGTLAPGSTTKLRVTLALPDTNEVTTNGITPTGSVQGLSTTLTWTFAQTQRTATTTSS